MRIITAGTHDYYDVVQKHGHSNEGNIFLRKPEEIIIRYQKNWTASGWKYDTKNHPLDFLTKNCYTNDYFRFSNRVSAVVKSFKILFCGRVYPGLKFYINANAIHYCYNTESVKELFKSQDTELPKTDTKLKGKSIAYSRDFLTRESLDQYFLIRDHTDISLQNKFIIAILTDITSKQIVIQNNAILSEYEFQRILDPYSAYQEISQFVDNLAYPGNIEYEIPDEYKIESKGFDSKYGFRTRPRVQ